MRKGRSSAAGADSDVWGRWLYASEMIGLLIWSDDGRIVDANDALLRLTGYDRDDVRDGRINWRTITPPEYSQLDQRALEELRDRGTCTPFEKAYRRKDGSLVPVLVGAATLDRSGRSGVAFVVDISKRRQAETELRQSQERYRLLFAANPMPMWVFDVHTLRFLDVNAAATADYGYSRDEFLRMTLPDIRPPESVASLLEQVQEPGGAIRRRHTARHRTKDGRLLDVEVTAAPLSAEDSIRLAVVNDVTAKSAAERTRREFTEELERRVAQRTHELAVANKELESFAYAVSHDLRTPLRALDGFSQALLEDCAAQLDAVGQDYLMRIRRGSQKMGALIDALLELSRVTRETLRRAPVDLSAIARDVVDTLHQAEPLRDVTVAIAPDLRVEGDAMLLRILLDNLIGNAWKFTAGRAGARIEVAAHADTQRGGMVYVVRDNGVGFDMAYADKLFGAFQRLHSSRDFPGTGIGLATAQRIVHRHGGDIWADAAPGNGACFYFTLR